jgi:MYXO-CTERM domain-containing protein
MLAVLVMANVVVAKTIVVDHAGSGDVATIEAAWELLADGDEILILPGEYFPTNLHTSAEGIKLTGSGADVTTINGGLADRGNDMTFQGSVEISQLHFKDFTKADMTLENGNMVGISAIILDPRNAETLTIRDCRFTNNGVGVSLTFEYYARVGVDAKELPEVQILDSVFVENKLAIGLANQANVTVENNLLQGNYFGIYLTYVGRADRMVVLSTHNTMVGQVIDLARGSGYDWPEPTLVHTNNIHVDSGAVMVSYSHSDDLELAWNLLDNVDSFWDSWSDPEARSGDHDNLEGSADFVAYTPGAPWEDQDFHLLPGSEAIDLGEPGYSSLGVDLDGTTRPLDGDLDGTARPDAGADELNPDVDDDGHADEALGGTDCDDADATIHPDATDVCGDGVDQDCADGDAVCDSGGSVDSGEEGDSADSGDSTTAGDSDSPPGDSGDESDKDGPCSCTTASPTGGVFALLTMVLAVRRRRAVLRPLHRFESPRVPGRGPSPPSR